MADPGSLVLDGVTLELKGRVLFAPLSLAVEPGRVVTVMGRSGAGKSSLLAYICGGLNPDFIARGEIRLAGREIVKLAPEKRKTAILYQDDLLFPHMTVAENLLFAIPGHVRGKKQRLELALGALERAGLEGFAENDPAALSGGQRARVAVMRTLLSEPDALLLDEPFARLDAETREGFRAFVFGHAAKEGLPTLMVTHDPEDGRAAGGGIVKLEPPAGAASGAPSAETA